MHEDHAVVGIGIGEALGGSDVPSQMQRFDQVVHILVVAQAIELQDGISLLLQRTNELRGRDLSDSMLLEEAANLTFHPAYSSVFCRLWWLFLHHARAGN